MEEINIHTIETLPAGTLDATVIRRFFHDCVAEYPYMAGVLRHAEWPQKLSENADCVCVRDSKGLLCGALFCYCNDMISRIAYIPFFAVLSTCRAYASGVDLHAAYLVHACACGLTKSNLEVDDFNTRAADFYDWLGYERVSCENGKVLLSMGMASCPEVSPCGRK